MPPSATRLLARVGPLSGERLGLEVLVALLLGIPALISGALPRTPGPDAGPETGGEEPATAGSHGHENASGDGAPASELRIRRAAAAGLSLWLLTGIVLFSDMTRLHPRYVEGLTPAVAAMLGIGVAWAASARGRVRLLALCAALVVTVIYAERLLFGRPALWWIVLAGALGAIALAVLERLPSIGLSMRARVLPAGVLVMTLVAVLAIPVSTDARAIKNRVSDAGYVGALPGEEQRLVSAYLLAHQDGARYEVAAESATGIGSLIVKDARPIVVLTSYGSRVFTTVAELERLIAEGKVRYAFLNSDCGPHDSSATAACSAPAKWVRAHGTDVSRQAGLSRPRVLWLLPGAKP